MALAANSQILPVGITSDAPFGPNEGVFVDATQPPSVSGSPSLRRVPGAPDQIEIGPVTTPLATVIGFGATVPVGGVGSQVVIGTSATVTETQDSVAIGHAAATGTIHATNGAIAIGPSAAVGGAGSNAGGGVAIGNGALANNGVAIGPGATCLLGQVALGASSTAENFAVAIGGAASALVGGAHGNGSVAIGRNAIARESTDIVIATGGGGTAAGAGGNVYIGGGIGGAGVSGHDCVVIGGSSNTGGGSSPAAASGNFATVIGGNSTAAHAGARLLGRGITSTAANQTLIGGTDDPAASVLFGNGAVGAAPQNVTIGVTGGSGVDVGGAQLIIAGGIATGAGTGGPILFQTIVVAGSSATPQALATALTIDNTQTLTIPNAPVFGATVAPGAVVLTLTNGPTAAAAGNPQTYLAFKSGVHTYAIPAYQVA